MFCDEVKNFLAKEHQYFLSILEGHPDREEVTSLVLSHDFMFDILAEYADKITPAVEDRVGRVIDKRKWQIRQLLESKDYDGNEVREFLERLVERRLGLREGEKIKKLNAKQISYIESGVGEDSDDCPQISNVWEQVKRGVRRR